ncbi:MAG: hypothetical protein QG657_3966, partial [Acidobacteriota bacterium]|nr:hypothetical protein [Acidobacteriota bacterium]
MRKKFFRSIIFPILFAMVSIAWLSADESKKEQTQTADMVLTGGKIITLDEVKPTVEAVAVYQGRILAIGSSAEIKPYISKATQVINLDGKTAIP